VISVGFWRWCVGIERIVLLDFIHRLVSQKIEEIKIYIPQNHNTHVQNSHKGQLLTTEPPTWVHTQHKPLRQVRHRWQQMTQPLHKALWLVIDPCVNFGRVYCDFLVYIFYSSIFLKHQTMDNVQKYNSFHIICGSIFSAVSLIVISKSEFEKQVEQNLISNWSFIVVTFSKLLISFIYYK
jgi:hypothetical protein